MGVARTSSPWWPMGRGMFAGDLTAAGVAGGNPAQVLGSSPASASAHDAPSRIGVGRRFIPDGERSPVVTTWYESSLAGMRTLGRWRSAIGLGCEDVVRFRREASVATVTDVAERVGLSVSTVSLI
jgi:hypothetical protein